MEKDENKKKKDPEKWEPDETLYYERQDAQEIEENGNE